MIRAALSSILLLGAGSVRAASPEMWVWTEMTGAGRAFPQPSPDAPAYYQAINVGYQTFSRAMAGDREPPPDEFLQTIIQLLRSQGFLPSGKSHSPSLVLGFSWGDLRRDFAAALTFLGAEHYGLLGYIDPVRYGTPVPVYGGDRHRLLSLASVDLYVVTIAAYDREEAIRGHLVKLWQTRIACPARGFYAETALPQILVAAAPYIGRETNGPQWLKPSDVARRAEVQIGELTRLGTIDAGDAVLIDIPKERAAAEAGK